MKPFLKWPGGKRQLLPQITERMPSSYGRYFEPFIGGGAVLLSTLPEEAIINDVNPQLINCYEQVKSNVEDFIFKIRALDGTKTDEDFYFMMREKYNQKIINKELDVDCAALMIWINKHCFNGLYRVNSKGLFNVSFNNKTSGASIDEENLRAISKYLSGVTILNGDFEDACKDVKPSDFVYFDSPYIPVSKTANFTDYTKDGFTYEDHIRLVELFKRLDSLGAKVMLSNNNVNLVHELYSGFNIEEVGVRRCINCDASKRIGKEVIITNY